MSIYIRLLEGIFEFRWIAGSFDAEDKLKWRYGFRGVEMIGCRERLGGLDCEKEKKVFCRIGREA